MKKILAVALAFSSTACASILGLGDAQSQPSVVTTVNAPAGAMFVIGDRVLYATLGTNADIEITAADGSGASGTKFDAEYLTDLVSDGTTICGKGGSLPAAIECADLTSGSLATIAQFDNTGKPSVFLQGIAMHGGNVFWTTQSINDANSTLTEAIQYAPAQGGSSSPTITTVYSEEILITTTSRDPQYQDIAADDTNVYFSDGKGTVSSVVWSGSPKTNQTPTVLATDAPTGVQSFTVDSTNIYLATESQSSGDTYGTIYAIPIGGGSTSTLIGDTSITGYVSDGAFVYVNEVGGIISKIPVSGGSPIELASGQGGLGAIDVDSQFLYWVTVSNVQNEYSSTIYRAPK